MEGGTGGKGGEKERRRKERRTRKNNTRKKRKRKNKGEGGGRKISEGGIGIMVVDFCTLTMHSPSLLLSVWEK